MAIPLNEALSITEDTTRPFSIKWCTYDENRKTGGKILKLDNAVRVGASHNRKANGTIVVKQLGNSHHPHTIHNPLIIEVNGQTVFI